MCVYNPPVNADYAEVNVPEHVNIRTLMKHFYRFTEKSKCLYIWADLQRRKVEIWGYEDTIPRAIQLVRKKIDKMAQKNMEMYATAQMITWNDGTCKFFKITGENRDVIVLANRVLSNTEEPAYITEFNSNSILLRRYM